MIYYGIFCYAPVVLFICVLNSSFGLTAQKSTNIWFEGKHSTSFAHLLQQFLFEWSVFNLNIHIFCEISIYEDKRFTFIISESEGR